MSSSPEELLPVFALLSDRIRNRVLLHHALLVEGNHYVCGHCGEREEFAHKLFGGSPREQRCTKCSHVMTMLGRIDEHLSDERLAELDIEYRVLFPHLRFVGRVSRHGTDFYLDQVNPALSMPELVSSP